MSMVESTFVLLPRFTSLAGSGTFNTLPLDVSSYGGAQFQVFRGAFRVKSGTPAERFTIYFEESLDAETWVLGPSTPAGYDIVESHPTFFSYSFRLRWFRMRVVLTADEPIVTCWAEGLLRGGGSGLWTDPSVGRSPGGEVSARAAMTPIELWQWQQRDRERIQGYQNQYDQVLARLQR